MKTLRLFLLSLLAIATAVPAVAQVIEDGEAFYIYRNDGNFDGFFYDEVKEIRYSKLDLDSVEHEDYVVQEVVLEDSIHRIPLAAIDSVGFVQPEIIYSPKLKLMDEIGMTQYAQRGFHDFIFYIDKTIPSHLMPKVGDVVISQDKYRFGIDVFGGKIKSISSSGDTWEIMLEKVSSLEDVFVQFISIEQVKADRKGNVKRRIAGFKKTRKAEGDFDASIFNFSGTIKKEFEPWGGTGTLALTLDTEINLSLAMTYNISWRKLFVKASISEFLSVGIGASATIDGQIEKSIPVVADIFGTLKFPATLPIFQTKPFPEIFARLHGEISAKLAFPKLTYSASQTVIFDSSANQMISGTWHQNEVPKAEEEKSFFDEFETGVTINGFMQFGLKNILAIQTNDWVSDIFAASFGVDIYTGPKLAGEFSFDPKKFVQSIQEGNTFMLKDIKVTVTFCSIDMEGKAKMKYLWKDEKEDKFFESSLKIGEFDWYLLPEIFDATASYDNTTEAINCHFKVRRNVLLPCEIGMLLYKGRTMHNEITDEYFRLYDATYKWAEDGVNHNFLNVYAGHYTIFPAVKLLGVLHAPYTQRKYVRIEPYLDLEAESVYNLGCEGGRISIPYKTNAAPGYLRVLTGICSYEIDKEKKVIYIDCPPNETNDPMQYTVYISAGAHSNNGASNDIAACKRSIEIRMQGSGN